MITDFKVYTVEEVAQSLKMNSRTIREYIRNGELKATRIGRKYVITQENYETFLSNDHTTSKGEAL